jgi:hypothetical protein
VPINDQVVLADGEARAVLIVPNASDIVSAISALRSD